MSVKKLSASHEVVSWNTIITENTGSGHTVGLSRGRELKYLWNYGRNLYYSSASHEVVSWNISIARSVKKPQSRPLTRSWVEIWWYCRKNSAGSCRPLTRSWVEISGRSTSKVGERGRPLTRSWVEISSSDVAARSQPRRPLTRSWVEIWNAADTHVAHQASASHEVVSWNAIWAMSTFNGQNVGLSRGRELKCKKVVWNQIGMRSASHEVVSWNISSSFGSSGFRSASHEVVSWNNCNPDGP